MTRDTSMQSPHRSDETPLGSSTYSRRAVLGTLAGLGIGTPVFQRALAAEVERSPEVTAEMIQQAEWIAGIELTEQERKAAAAAVTRDQQKFELLRKVPLD